MTDWTRAEITRTEVQYEIPACEPQGACLNQVRRVITAADREYFAVYGKVAADDAIRVHVTGDSILVAFEKKQPETEKSADDFLGRIADAAKGRIYYTVPWAMRADREGRLWLNSEFPLRVNSFGAFSMRFERRDDGYHVWANAGSSQKLSEYAAPRMTGYIRVTKLEPVTEEET